MTLPPVCGGTRPIKLHHLRGAPSSFGIAEITPIPLRWKPYNFPSWQRVELWTNGPIYGDLGGDAGAVAALSFSCTNGGGTADGELLNGSVVFSGAGDKLAVAGVVTPQAKHHPTDPPTTIGIKVAPGKITADEFWSDRGDVAGWATTVWTHANGRLSPGTPAVSCRPPAWWPYRGGPRPRICPWTRAWRVRGAISSAQHRDRTAR